MIARSLKAWKEFKENVIQQNGKLLEEEWKGSGKPYKAVCHRGHICFPYPNHVQQGGNICKTCAAKTDYHKDRSAKAWESFKENVSAQGGVVLEKEWKGSGAPHEVTCRKGHICFPRPGGVHEGKNICGACAGVDPVYAERQFRSRIASQGARPNYGKWEGCNTPHAIICSAGHKRSVYPSSVQLGRNVCATCSRKNRGARQSLAAEQRFQSELRELDARPAYIKWQGGASPHRVICRFGHICFPYPFYVKRGIGICSTCSNRNPKESIRKLKNDLSVLGVTLLEEQWLGATKPHRVLCPSGHGYVVRPAHIQQEGRAFFCPLCIRVWNVFYVVTNTEEVMVKFGITSGNACARLKIHANDGFAEQSRLLLDLPGTTARDLESLCKSTLHDAGWTPVRGREYFDIGALPTVLDIVDNYPIPGR